MDAESNTIKLSTSETELLKKALEEAAEQASVPAAGETTQFLRKKADGESKVAENTSNNRRTLI